MYYRYKKILVILFLVLANSTLFSQNPSTFVRSQNILNGLNISAYISNTGIFNQNLDFNNHPGLIWPKNSGKHAIFSSGITIAAYINGNFRMASNSWTGEYRPGYIDITSSTPVPKTDDRFKIYRISQNDNCNNSLDWAEWANMVQFGAPYNDINNNCVYDPCIDIPGVDKSYETVFVHLTDGFQESHNSSEGFGGGTLPLNAELSITAWTYWEMPDIQYFKFNFVNKNNSPWEMTRFALMSDPDLGDASDDLIGCDTLRNLGYTYNYDNEDGGAGPGPGTYGQNPPSVGQKILKTLPGNEKLTSFVRMNNSGSGGLTCEREPNGAPEAVNFMNGLKNDGTPFVHPVTFQPTKLIYPGDPDLFTGWSERGTDGDSALANVHNCNGSLTGPVFPSLGGNRFYVMGIGPFGFTINPLDTMPIFISQMVAKGSNNFNAVTKLKLLSDQSQRVFDFCYSETHCDAPDPNSIPPENFYLSNNFPNPFNPSTKITYGLPYEFKLEISVYDVLGNEVSVLFDGVQKAGNYTLEFDGRNLPSGIYFLKFKSGSFIITRKMMLLK